MNATRLPQRPSQHQLADESVRFFRNCLPGAWICDEPKNDYGVDLRVGLASDGYVSGQSLVVQMKASAVASEGDTVPLRLEVATLNYLKNLLEVVLLVKYIASEQAAYWLFLKDVPRPKEDQRSITIRVPRNNRLSINSWDVIARHVDAVHHRKLSANAKEI